MSSCLELSQLALFFSFGGDCRRRGCRAGSGLFSYSSGTGRDLRLYIGEYVLAHSWAICVWLAVLAALAALVTLLLRWEPFIGGSGIPQVEGEMHGCFFQKWWRVLLA